MDVKRKADCEQPLATIDVMNRIARVFGCGPLRGATEVSGHYNLFLREVECARPTTSLSRKERKEAAVRVARPGCPYSAEKLSYYERNQDWYIHRDYTELCNLSYMPTEYSFQTMWWPLHWKEHQPLSRQRVVNGALSRSCGRVEKNFELSTTTTASMTPVPIWTSALTRTTTRSVKWAPPASPKPGIEIPRDWKWLLDYDMEWNKRAHSRLQVLVMDGSDTLPFRICVARLKTIIF